MSDFDIIENFILTLPEFNVVTTVRYNPAECESISAKELSGLIKQIEYQKPVHTQIRISEAFLEELKSLDIIQYNSDVTMTGLRMIVDNSIDTFKFE